MDTECKSHIWHSHPHLIRKLWRCDADGILNPHIKEDILWKNINFISVKNKTSCTRQSDLVGVKNDRRNSGSYAPSKFNLIDFWHLTFNQWTNGPMDQWTNGQMDQWSPRYPQDIPKIFRRYPEDILKMFQRYPKDIPKISPASCGINFIDTV